MRKKLTLPNVLSLYENLNEGKKRKPRVKSFFLRIQVTPPFGFNSVTLKERGKIHRKKRQSALLDREWERTTQTYLTGGGGKKDMVVFY